MSTEDTVGLEPFTIDPNKEPEKAVKVYFLNNVVAASDTIVKTAKGELDNRLRFNAAAYVIEFIMGKPGDSKGEGDPLEELRKKLDLLPDAKK